MENEPLRILLSQLARGITAQFGPQCEVTVHDLSKEPDATICAIENGHVTGRKIGDGASEVVLRALKEPHNATDQLAYQIRTENGRVLKASTMFVRDEAGAILAVLGINYDITDLLHAAGVINNLITPDTAKRQDESNMQMLFSNVDDLLDRLIEQSAEHVGKPVAMMSKEDKTRAIQYLDEKGAFLIKKAGDRVSRFYDISKYTLYNYLDAKLPE